MASHQFDKGDDMLGRLQGKTERLNEQPGRIGKTWRELDGHPCPYCGCSRYTLLFRFEARGQAGLLSAKCSQCNRQRDIHEQDLEQDLRRKKAH